MSIHHSQGIVDAYGDHGRIVAGLRFDQRLKMLRRSKKLSCNRLARLAHVDHTYVSRMELGDRGAPGPGVLESLVSAMEVNEIDGADLFVSAGFAPQVLVRYGHWTRSLQGLLEMLADPVAQAEAGSEIEAFMSHIERCARKIRTHARLPQEA